MNRKTKKHVLAITKTIIKSILPALVGILFCWIFLYGNSHVDSSNTYTVDCSIESIYFDNPHKGRSKGVITTTAGEVYEIYSVFLDYDEAERLLKSDREVSLVVWNYPFVLGPPIKTIVDMRSESTVYHTIDDQNEYSRNQRIGYWLTLIPLFSVFFIGLSVLFLYLEFAEKIRRYRRRRIKKMKKMKKKRELSRMSKDSNDNDS